MAEMMTETIQEAAERICRRIQESTDEIIQAELEGSGYCASVDVEVRADTIRYQFDILPQPVSHFHHVYKPPDHIRVKTTILYPEEANG
jgi:RecJ-like exonuclease